MKKVLHDGVCWHVSTGSSISIVNDAWYLSAFDSRLSHIVINGNLLTVDQLINNQTKEWKKDLVEYTFSSVDATRILKIPLACIPHENEIAWIDEPLGVF